VNEERNDRHKAQPPTAVPGDPVQPSNQPVDDEVVSVPLEMDESGGESVIGQQNFRHEVADGGGEFPDPDAPARGPAPGNRRRKEQET
jgi:hypothetical protein